MLYIILSCNVNRMKIIFWFQRKNCLLRPYYLNNHLILVGKMNGFYILYYITLRNVIENLICGLHPYLSVAKEIILRKWQLASSFFRRASFVANPPAVGRDTRVDARFARLAASDAPRNDAHRRPTARRPFQHQRSTRVTLENVIEFPEIYCNKLYR